jgi:hypothetical protein
MTTTTEHDPKRLASLRAAFALKGHELVELPGSLPPRFRAIWRGLCRDLRDLDEAEEFLRRIGGRL